MIKVDFAPLEGITDSIYRKAHHAHFGGVDRYFTLNLLSFMECHWKLL